MPGIVKLYIEKAYDLVNCVCLLHMLDCYGFGERRRKWNV